MGAAKRNASRLGKPLPTMLTTHPFEDDKLREECGVFGIWEPGPNRPALLDNFKKRCEQFASLGLTRLYSPSAAMR